MKKLFVGLIVGLMIGTAGTALAADEAVQAKFAKYFLKIDDRESVEIEPLVYKGTTYLPVREAAELLGYEVTYRADSRTIELTSAKSENDLKEVEEMPNIETQNPETNLEGWLKREDLQNHGIKYYFTVYGEQILEKDGQKIVLTGDRPKLNEEVTYEYNGITIRMTSLPSGYYFNVEDLQTAGLID